MAVALDVIGTGSNWASTAGATGITNTGITVGSGSNRALIVGLIFDGATTNLNPVVTWDSGGTNQAMTLIRTVASNAGSGFPCRVHIFGLVAPTSGNLTLKVTWTGSSAGYVNCIAFTGVNQTGGTTSFASAGDYTGFSSGTMSFTSTGTANDASVTVTGHSPGAYTTNRTNWWADTARAADVDAIYMLGVGTFSDTLGGSGDGGGSGFTLVAGAAAAAAASSSTLPMMGV